MIAVGTSAQRAVRRLPSRLAGDNRGSTIIEFAIIAPVLLTLLIGIFDLGQMAYAISTLNGAVQKAARDSALESANTSVADTIVKSKVSPVLPKATFASTRISYFDFKDIGRSERWNDGNNNGTCDSGEAYVDENNNGNWDLDIGLTGNGGANDVVVYTMTVTYKPTFHTPFMPSKWGTRTLSATAIRKNQPFATQTAYGSNAGTC
jgi:Flp pilus assembly protein TadG